MECIVLAGGLGTRLRGVIGAQPKCMAAVNGLPFLHYLFRYLERQGITRTVLSLGYQSGAVQDWCRAHKQRFAVDDVVEQEPLGTGGGIRLALQQCREPQVFVVNGDTMFDAGLPALHAAHLASGAHATLALKPMRHFDRYGTLATDAEMRLTEFLEKRPQEQGLINGGIYLIDRDRFLSLPLPEKFSFEKDYLERYLQQERIMGHVSDGYFIDIGVPEDFARAQTELPSLFEKDPS